MNNKLPLTKKKSQWIKNRKVTLRGNPLFYNAGIQEKYVKELKKLVGLMTRTTYYHINNLFKGSIANEFFEEQQKREAIDSMSFAFDASLASKARILMNTLTRKFSQLFGSKAKFLSEKMFSNQEKISKSNLHSSLEKLSGGLSLKTSITTGIEDISQALIAENVSLIKSIPSEYFKQVTGSVMRSISKGQGVADLIPALKLMPVIEKYGKMTERRAELIALDQTRKAYNSINKQKMVALNVKQFEWNHSGSSQHPRESHKKINGVIFSFENFEAEQAALGVPEHDRGIPGYPPYCRCTMIPVIDFSDD